MHLASRATLQLLASFGALALHQAVALTASSATVQSSLDPSVPSLQVTAGARDLRERARAQDVRSNSGSNLDSSHYFGASPTDLGGAPDDSVHLQKRAKASVEKPTVERFSGKAVMYGNRLAKLSKAATAAGTLGQSSAPVSREEHRMLMSKYQSKIDNNLDKAEFLHQGNFAGIRRIHSHKQNRLEQTKRWAQTSVVKAKKAKRKAKYWGFKAQGDDAAAEKLVKNLPPTRPIVRDAQFYAAKAAEQGQEAVWKLQIGAYWAKEPFEKQKHSLLKERAVRSNDPRLAQILADYYTAKAGHHEQLASEMAQKSERYKGQTKAWAKVLNKAKKEHNTRMDKGVAVFPEPRPVQRVVVDPNHNEITNGGNGVEANSAPAHTPSQAVPTEAVSEVARQSKGKEVLVDNTSVASTSGTKDEPQEPVRLRKRAHQIEKPTPDLFVKKASKYLAMDNALTAASNAAPSGSRPDQAHQVSQNSLHHKLANNLNKASVLEAGDVAKINLVRSHKEEKADRHMDEAKARQKELNKSRWRATYWQLKASGMDKSAEMVRKLGLKHPVVHDRYHYSFMADLHAHKAKWTKDPNLAQRHLANENHSLLKERAVRTNDRQDARELALYHSFKVHLRQHKAKEASQLADKYKAQKQAWSEAATKAEKWGDAKRRAGQAVFAQPPATTPELLDLVLQMPDDAEAIPSPDPSVARAEYIASLLSSSTLQKQKAREGYFSSMQHTDKGKEVKIDPNAASTSDSKDQPGVTARLNRRSLPADTKPTVEKFERKAAIHYPMALSSASDGVISETRFRSATDTSRLLELMKHYPEEALRDLRVRSRYKYVNNIAKLGIINRGDVEDMRKEVIHNKAGAKDSLANAKRWRAKAEESRLKEVQWRKKARGVENQNAVNKRGRYIFRSVNGLKRDIVQKRRTAARAGTASFYRSAHALEKLKQYELKLKAMMSNDPQLDLQVASYYKQKAAAKEAKAKTLELKSQRHSQKRKQWSRLAKKTEAKARWRKGRGVAPEIPEAAPQRRSLHEDPFVELQDSPPLQKRSTRPVPKRTVLMYQEKAALHHAAALAASTAGIISMRRERPSLETNYFHELMEHYPEEAHRVLQERSRRKYVNNFEKARIINDEDLQALREEQSRSSAVVFSSPFIAKWWKKKADSSLMKADQWSEKAEGKEDLNARNKGGRLLLKPSYRLEDKIETTGRLAIPSRAENGYDPDFGGAAHAAEKQMQYELRLRAMTTNDPVLALQISDYYKRKATARLAKVEKLKERKIRYAKKREQWSKLLKQAQAKAQYRKRRGVAPISDAPEVAPQRRSLGDNSAGGLIGPPRLQKRAATRPVPKRSTALYRAKAAVHYPAALSTSTDGIISMERHQPSGEMTHFHELMLHYPEEAHRYLAERSRRKFVNNLEKARIINEGDAKGLREEMNHSDAISTDEKLRAKDWSKKVKSTMKKADQWSKKAEGRENPYAINKQGRLLIKSPDFLRRKIESKQRLAVRALEDRINGKDFYQSAHALEKKKEYELRLRAMTTNDPQLALQVSEYYKQRAIARKVKVRKMREKSRRYAKKQKQWSQLTRNAEAKAAYRRRRAVVPGSPTPPPSPDHLAPGPGAEGNPEAVLRRRGSQEPSLTVGSVPPRLVKRGLSDRLDSQKFKQKANKYEHLLASVPQFEPKSVGVPLNPRAQGEEASTSGTAHEAAHSGDSDSSIDIRKRSFAHNSVTSWTGAQGFDQQEELRSEAIEYIHFEKRNWQQKPSAKIFREKADHYDRRRKVLMDRTLPRDAGLLDQAISAEERHRREQLFGAIRKYDDNVEKVRALEADEVAGLDTIKFKKHIKADSAEAMADGKVERAKRSRARQEYWTYMSKGNKAAAEKAIKKYKASRPLIHSPQTYAQKAHELSLLLDQHRRGGRGESQDVKEKIVKHLYKGEAVRSGSREFAANLARHYKERTAARDEIADEWKQRMAKYKGQEAAWAVMAKKARKRRDARKKSRRRVFQDPDVPADGGHDFPPDEGLNRPRRDYNGFSSPESKAKESQFSEENKEKVKGKQVMTYEASTSGKDLNSEDPSSSSKHRKEEHALDEPLPESP